MERIGRRMLAVLLAATWVAGPSAPGAAAAPNRPDLQVSALTIIGSATVSPGSGLVVRTTVANRGRGRARASTTHFFLSLDRKLSLQDQRIGSLAVPALKPRKTRRGQPRLVIPQTISPSNLFLLACVDARRVVKESKETNNCRAGAVLLRIQTAGPSPTPGPTATATPAASPMPVQCTPGPMQMVTLSDWHGQLDPLPIGQNELRGGASALAHYFKQDRAANPRTLVLSSGDSFGATPHLSGLWGDEPAVKAFNLMGVDADTFGNHMFNRGVAHTQTLLDVATYELVTSNLQNLSANLSGVNSPFRLFQVGDVTVGVVGIVNPDTAALVDAGELGTMVLADAVGAAQNARAAAEAAGAEVVVGLVHLYVNPGDGTGPLVQFAQGVTGFDFILGESRGAAAYNATIGGTLVIANPEKGRSYTRVTFDADGCGAVSNRLATVVEPTVNPSTNTPSDPAMDAMLAPYRAGLKAKTDAKIATLDNKMERGPLCMSPPCPPGTLQYPERTQEVPLGNLVADAMRARYGTQLAMISGGHLRSPLPSSYAPDPALGLNRASPPYDLVVGDIYTLLPFGNRVVVTQVTGQTLWGMAERGVSAMPAVDGKFPQISGFKFEWSQSAPVGARVRQVTIVTPSGEFDISRTHAGPFTIAVSDLHAGGAEYPMLADHTAPRRETIADIVLEDVNAQAVLTAPPHSSFVPTRIIAYP